MKKILIIDGPDGTGKTTLANKLSEAYNIPIYHLTYYEDRDEHQRQFDYFKRLVNESTDGFILDRYICSEIVYANVYRPRATTS